MLTGETALQIPTGSDQLVASVEPSPNGKYLLTAGDTTVLWDIHTGEEIQRFDHRSFSIAFSPDGKHILTGGLDDGTIYLWNTVTGEREREYIDHTGPISDLRFSNDAQEFLSASWDATAILWDVQTGNIIHRYQHQGALNAALFHPDGKRIITVAGDNLVRIWDKDTGAELQRFNAPTGNFNDAVLMPDGEHIMVAATDGTTRLYELNTGNEVGRYQGHNEIVFNLAISSDGMRMLTSSWDGTARVWSLSLDDLIQTVCDYLPRDLTQDEWQQYLPDRKRNITCPK